jgi:hypothetical protein
MSKRSLAQLLTDAARAVEAESSREITCPHCHETFTTSWRTDESTTRTDNDDPENEQDDDAEVNHYNNRTVTRLKALAQGLTAASNKSSQR